MRLKFFTVPVSDAGDAEREVNAFLSRHRVLGLDRQLVRDDAGSYWALCVSYLEPGKPSAAKGQHGKLDYKEVLPPAEFEAFAHLRRVRKELAERDGVPPYHVFNNEQLAAIVQQRITALDELARLSGVGPARIAKYGRAVLGAYKEVSDRLIDEEEPGAADNDLSG